MLSLTLTTVTKKNYYLLLTLQIPIGTVLIFKSTWTPLIFVHRIKGFKVSSIVGSCRMNLGEGQVRKPSEEIVQKTVITFNFDTQTDYESPAKQKLWQIVQLHFELFLNVNLSLKYYSRRNGVTLPFRIVLISTNDGIE